MLSKHFYLLCLMNVISVKLGLCENNLPASQKIINVTTKFEHNNLVTSSELHNESFAVDVSNNDSYFIQMTCWFHKPVTWSFKLNAVSDLFIRDISWITHYRTSEEFSDSRSFLYFSTLQIHLTDNFLRLSKSKFWSCEADEGSSQVSRNSSPRVTVALLRELDPAKNSRLELTVFYYKEHHANNRLKQITILNSTKDTGRKDQECQVEYWIRSISVGKLEWKCVFPKLKDATRLLKQQLDAFCATESHCSVYDKYNTPVNTCVKQMNSEDECQDCIITNGLSTSLLVCDNEFVLSGQPVVYSLGSDKVLPKPHFPRTGPQNSLQKADFMYMKQIPKYLILGDVLTLECQASEFMFASSPVFGFKYANSSELEYLHIFPESQLEIAKTNVTQVRSVSEEFLNPTWYDSSTNTRTYKHELLIAEKFWTHNGGLERIYCYLPVWNTDEWVFKYQDVSRSSLFTVEENVTPALLYEASTPKITILPEFPPGKISTSDFLILEDEPKGSHKWSVRINCSFHEPIIWQLSNPEWEKLLNVTTELRRKMLSSRTNLKSAEFLSSIKITGNEIRHPFIAICSSVRKTLLRTGVIYSNGRFSNDDTPFEYTKTSNFRVLSFIGRNESLNLGAHSYSNARSSTQNMQILNATEFEKDCPVTIVVKVIDGSQGRFDWTFMYSQPALNLSSKWYEFECRDFLSCELGKPLSLEVWHVRKEFQKCLKILGASESCNECHKSVVDTRMSFTKYIVWFNPGVGYLYQAVHKLRDSNIHFTIPPSEYKIKLEGIPEIVYVNQTLFINCSASPLVYSRGLKLAFVYETGSEKYAQYTLDQDYVNYTQNSILIKTVQQIFKNQSTLREIKCYAPRCDAVEFTNASVRFEVQDSSPPIIFREGELENITYFIDDTNKTLECASTGIPKPYISWVYPNSFQQFHNHELASSLIPVLKGNMSVLLFKDVLQSHSGIYKCTASSVVGMAHKYFNVTVVDSRRRVPSNTSADSSLLISVLTVIGVLVCCLLLYLLRRIWFLQNSVQGLTESEIKQYRDGVPVNELTNSSADDVTNSLIYCQPYNHTLEISRSNLQIDRHKILGSGNFGVVCRGYILTDASTPVALKLVKPLVPLEIFKSFLAEIKVLAYMGNHINIVKFHGACTSRIRENDVIIALEFCVNGSLKDFLCSHREDFEEGLGISTRSSEVPRYENTCSGESRNIEQNAIGNVFGIKRLLNWCADITNAFEYLESKRIVHGDLATRNVLLTQNYMAKISDFGLSRILSECSNYARSPRNCPMPWMWLAIESLTERKFSCLSDVWSFGITMWEIFALGEVPYPGISWSLEFTNLLKSGLRPSKPEAASITTFETMQQCWMNKPQDRPSFADLKQNIHKLILENGSSSL